jgi:iron(III) transport system permease protein
MSDVALEQARSRGPRGEEGAGSGRRWLPRGGATLVLVAIVAFFICYPVVVMVLKLFFPSGRLNTQTFSDAYSALGLSKVLRDTAIAVGVSSVLAVALGSMLAWLNERTDAGIKGFGTVLPIMPLLVPPLAGTVGWLLLATSVPGLLNSAIRHAGDLVGVDLGLSGPLEISTWGGLIFLYTVYLVPYVYLTMSAALRNIDPAMEEAARVSGASAWYTMRHVSLPSVKRALGASMLLAVMIGFALYSVPAIIGPQANIDILSVSIVRLVTVPAPPQPEQAAALSFIVLGVVGIVWSLQRRLGREGRGATIGGRRGAHTLVRLGKGRILARGLMFAYVAVTAVLPVVALLIVSLEGFWSAGVPWSHLTVRAYQDALLSDQGGTRQALVNSTVLGLVGATICIAIAAVLSNHTRRAHALGGRSIDALTKLPGVISHLVLGIAFILAFVSAPFNLGGTFQILLIAYVVAYLPQSSIAADSALAQVGGDLEEAAAVSGASPGRRFRRIVFPLSTPGLIGGWSILFVLIAGDVTISQLLAGIHTPVFGFTLIERWFSGTFPQLAALAMMITVVNCVIVSLALFVGRGRGAVGRVQRVA